MLRKLYTLLTALFLVLTVQENFAQDVRYIANFEDMSIKFLRCSVKQDNSCIVDFLMENNSVSDWSLYVTTWTSVIHKSRAYDDMGNEYSKIEIAVGNTSKYIETWDCNKAFPAGTVLKVRIKVHDISAIATVLKRLDIDVCNAHGWGSARKPITIFNIPISRQ